jgi:hypothetical protein
MRRASAALLGHGVISHAKSSSSMGLGLVESGPERAERKNGTPAKHSSFPYTCIAVSGGARARARRYRWRSQIRETRDSLENRFLNFTGADAQQSQREPVAIHCGNPRAMNVRPVTVTILVSPEAVFWQRLCPNPI